MRTLVERANYFFEDEQLNEWRKVNDVWNDIKNIAKNKELNFIQKTRGIVNSLGSIGSVPEWIALFIISFSIGFGKEYISQHQEEILTNIGQKAGIVTHASKEKQNNLERQDLLVDAFLKGYDSIMSGRNEFTSEDSKKYIETWEILLGKDVIEKALQK